MKYDYTGIEKKWQDRWEEAGIFHASNNSEKPKFFGLVEFPYPSGNGLHVGHARPYTALDVVSRKRRMEGYNVLFPTALLGGHNSTGADAYTYSPETNL